MFVCTYVGNWIRLFTYHSTGTSIWSYQLITIILIDCLVYHFKALLGHDESELEK